MSFFSIVRPVKNNWLGKQPSNQRVSTPTFYVALFSNKALAPHVSFCLFFVCGYEFVRQVAFLYFHVFGAYSLGSGNLQAKENCSDIIKGCIGHKNTTG